jgi:hypothetical protein
MVACGASKRFHRVGGNIGLSKPRSDVRTVTGRTNAALYFLGSGVSQVIDCPDNIERSAVV